MQMMLVNISAAFVKFLEASGRDPCCRPAAVKPADAPVATNTGHRDLSLHCAIRQSRSWLRSHGAHKSCKLSCCVEMSRGSVGQIGLALRVTEQSRCDG